MLNGLDDFTAYSYDTHSGAVRTIEHPHTDPQGKRYPARGRYPVASAGYAAFAVGAGTGGLTEVAGVDLATGASRVLRRGYAQAPIMVATAVIWPESAAPDVEMTLRVVEGAHRQDGGAVPGAARGARHRTRCCGSRPVPCPSGIRRQTRRTRSAQGTCCGSPTSWSNPARSPPGDRPLPAG